MMMMMMMMMMLMMMTMTMTMMMMMNDDDDDDDDDHDHDDDDDPYRSGQTMAFDRNITICITIAIIIPVTTAPTFHFAITLRYITLQCIRLHNIIVQYGTSKIL